MGIQHPERRGGHESVVAFQGTARDDHGCI